MGHHDFKHLALLLSNLLPLKLPLNKSLDTRAIIIFKLTVNSLMTTVL